MRGGSMATKPKAAAPPPDDDEADAESKDRATATEAQPKKTSLVGRILALPRLLNPLAFLKLSLKMKLVVGAALLVVFGGAGGAYYFFGSGSEEEVAEAEDVTTEAPNLPAEHAAFFDVPDIIVNIQTPDSTPAYLKLSVALELEKIEAKAAIEPVLPRVIDQFQTY